MTGSDAARDELVQQLRVIRFKNRYDRFDAKEMADAVLMWMQRSGYHKVTVTTEQIEAAKQKVAENQLRRYESQYQADHLTWREFYDEADEDVRTAARALGLSVAEDGAS